MPTSALINLHYAGIAAQVPELLRYASARCASTSTAEDRVEECIIRAITRLDTFRTEQEMRAWLFMTVHNLCVDDQEPRPGMQLLKLPDPIQKNRSYNRLLLRAFSKAAMTLPQQQRQDLALMADEIIWRENSPVAERMEIWHHRHSTTLH